MPEQFGTVIASTGIGIFPPLPLTAPGIPPARPVPPPAGARYTGGRPARQGSAHDAAPRFDTGRPAGRHRHPVANAGRLGVVTRPAVAGVGALPTAAVA